MGNSILKIVVEPTDVLTKELINLKGGISTAPISCTDGEVKCKDGDDKSKTLSAW